MPARETIEEVKFLIKEERLTVEELIKRTGKSRNTLYACLKEIERTGQLRRLPGSGNRIYYFLGKGFRPESSDYLADIITFEFRKNQLTIPLMQQTLETGASSLAQMAEKLSGLLAHALVRQWSMANYIQVPDAEQQLDFKINRFPTNEHIRETLTVYAEYLRDYGKLLSSVASHPIWDYDNGSILRRLAGSLKLADVVELAKQAKKWQDENVDYATLGAHGKDEFINPSPVEDSTQEETT